MFEDLERRRGEVERTRENSSRLAEAFAKFETTGQGTIEFEDRIDFGLTFIEEPYMAYGTQIDLDALSELLDVDPGTTPPLPLCSGMVTKWDQDDRDYYLGAWVAVIVYFPPGDTIAVPTTIQPTMQHFFSFTATAMKDVSPDLRD